MLEWLFGVWSRVVTLFSSLWGIIQWYTQQNWGSFSHYISSLRPSLNDYHYSRKGSLQRYQTSIEGNAIHVLQNNFSRANYVAVDGYYDLAEFRQRLLVPTREWKDTYRPYVGHLRNMDGGRIQTLIGRSVADVSFLGNEVPRHVKRYLSQERPAVVHYKGVKSKVSTLVEGNTPDKLRSLAVSHWGGVISIAVNHRGELEALAGRKTQVIELTNAGPLGRVFDLVGMSYGQIKSVASKHREIEGITQSERLAKILDFADRMYPQLNELSRDGSKTVLDLIEDDFLDWLFSLFADYLLSEV